MPLDEQQRQQQAVLEAQAPGHRPGDELLADAGVAARILQTVRTGLLMLDADGTCRVANRAFYLDFGVVPDAVLGRPWTALAGGALAGSTVAPQLEGLVRGPGAGFEGHEVALQLPERADRWFVVTGTDVHRAAGRGERFVLVAFEDITQERAMRIAAEEWRAELERSNRELEQFASVAAHDLQEPIRKILAFGEKLDAEIGAGLSANARRNLDKVLAAAARARSMIAGVLALSRASTRPLAIEPVDLDAALRDVVADLEAQLERTGGAVRGIGRLPVVQGDAVMLRQLLQNLVTNGLKFHREQTPPLVEVEATRVDDPRPAWRLAVRDNGIGFEDRFAPQLFQPFTRLNPRGTFEGAGIGLALCHRIVTRHGGTIAATGVPLGGATFVATLPITAGAPTA